MSTGYGQSDAGKGDGIRKDFDQEKFGNNLDKINLSENAEEGVTRVIKLRGKTRYVYGGDKVDSIARKEQFEKNRQAIRDANGKLK